MIYCAIFSTLVIHAPDVLDHNCRIACERVNMKVSTKDAKTLENIAISSFCSRSKMIG